MEYDRDKVDEMVLALLWLTPFDQDQFGARARKSRRQDRASTVSPANASNRGQSVLREGLAQRKNPWDATRPTVPRWTDSQLPGEPAAATGSAGLLSVKCCRFISNGVVDPLKTRFTNVDHTLNHLIAGHHGTVHVSPLPGFFLKMPFVIENADHREYGCTQFCVLPRDRLTLRERWRRHVAR